MFLLFFLLFHVLTYRFSISSVHSWVNIEFLSCKQIADRLNISNEMVKYYLFRARKIIRGGMDMDRILGEKSIILWDSKSTFGLRMAENMRNMKPFSKEKFEGTSFWHPTTILSALRKWAWNQVLRFPIRKMKSSCCKRECIWSRAKVNTLPTFRSLTRRWLADTVLVG